MERVELTGRDLVHLREVLDQTENYDLVRLWLDNGVKVKVNGGMWTAPLGEVKTTDY